MRWPNEMVPPTVSSTQAAPGLPSGPARYGWFGITLKSAIALFLVAVAALVLNPVCVFFPDCPRLGPGCRCTHAQASIMDDSVEQDDLCDLGSWRPHRILGRNPWCEPG